MIFGRCFVATTASSIAFCPLGLRFWQSTMLRASWTSRNYDPRRQPESQRWLHEGCTKTVERIVVTPGGSRPAQQQRHDDQPTGRRNPRPYRRRLPREARRGVALVSISHHGVPLLRQKQCSSRSFHGTASNEAVAHCFGTSRIRKNSVFRIRLNSCESSYGKSLPAGRFTPRWVGVLAKPGPEGDND